jgi:hypothetical protein
MITLSLVASGRPHGSHRAAFVRRCPYCGNSNTVLLGPQFEKLRTDGTLKTLDQSVCRHFRGSAEIKREGIYLRFGK